MVSPEEISSEEQEFINHLINFGISRDEARVYISLLQRGNRGEIVGRIKDEVEIGRTTIYAILERLCEKDWVVHKEISQNPKRIKYVANDPRKIFSKIIKKKENLLRLQKESNLLIGDKLEISYQGAKKLNLETVHPGAYKYLKPLINHNFVIMSEVIEHTEGSEYRISFDYELKGPKGFPKDCGLIIFEFNKNIENDERLIEDLFKMFKQKTEFEIKRDKIPGFQELKFEDAKFDTFLGSNVLIKLKLKKSWWKVGQQAVIPLKNRVFFIFGAEENFEILKESVLNSEKFHHLL